MADSVEKLLSKVGKLPTMPHVASKILELVSNPDTSATKLQRVIDSDQVLAMRILKVANSALYALPRKVKTLQQAIVMLGFNHIRSLVLAEAIQNLFKGKSKKGDLLESLLWEHSVGAAIGAKCAAQICNCPLGEEAFVASLIHDVGKLILLQGDPEAYRDIVETIYIEYQPFSDLEREYFDVEHAEVGALLAERWNLHEKLVEGIRLHHEPDGGDQLTDLIRIGNAIAYKAQWGFRKEPELDLATIPAAGRLGMDDEMLIHALNKAKELMETERQIFGVPATGKSS
ncbi:MAG: HDOD domain-containing protein [bacterium]|nr:HDOD domain-containing protein [bacterium]